MYLSVSCSNDASVPDEVDDDVIEEARFDERTALESIYGEQAFAEVWYEIGQVSRLHKIMCLFCRILSLF